MKKIKGIFAVALTVLCALCLFAFTSSAAGEGKWIKAWSTAATEIGVEGYDYIVPMVQNVATRTIITPTASGTKLRVKFSNYYGKEPLIIDRANIALSDTGKGASGIDKNTITTLTFSSKQFVTIPAGQEVYSDEVFFTAEAGKNIAVSVFFRDFMEVRTMGLTGGHTYLKTVLEGSGTDLIEAENFNILTDFELEEKWVYDLLDKLLGSIIGTGSLEVPISDGRIEVVPVVTDIEVLNPNDDAYSVVVIGDSTVANDYPAYLAQAIQGNSITDVGVGSKGLIGNQLLSDGLGFGAKIYGESLLSRMKKDIIGLDGKNSANVKYVILKTGANDIIHPVCSNIKDVEQPTAYELIEGYKKVFDFCHKNGIKVIVTGITPWGGYSGAALSIGPQYDRGPFERLDDWQIALDVNAWLENTSLHDGYVDYYEMSKNPLNTSSLLPEYTTDGLHPSDMLQRKWAESFPLDYLGINPRTMGVGISESDITIYKGDYKTLTAKVMPADFVNQAVTWSTSDDSVVKVDAKGKLYAVSRGTAVITVKTVDKGYSGQGYTATCKVTVKVKPSSVKITGDSAPLYSTKTKQLTATVSPADTDFKGVVWSSSNEKVATVNANGLVTATGRGTAVITAASSFDSNIKATFKITVNKKIQVQAIYLNYDERTRNVGTSFTLVPTMNPSNATFTDVTWSSSNKKIAKVDKNGKVTALKTGTAVITCKSVDNPKVTASCIVNVTIKTKGVELPTKKLTLYVSATKTLKAEVLPANATNKKVTWSSSNKSVATVSKSGKITAKKPGKTVITVKTKSGGYKATCTVTVKKFVKLKSFKLKKSSVTINDGKSYTLKAVFSPSNASNKNVTWKSSNTDIATVSSKGVVKAVKPGTVTITCKSKETGKTVKCTVKVKKVKVKKVLFAEKTYTVKHNGSLQLKALISPTNATNKKIKWKSSHPEFVKVNSKGKVTGLKLGKDATITATSVDGKYIASCRVKVEKVSVTALKLNKNSASVYTGGTVTLAPKFTPAKPSDSKVTWTSSDTKIATVGTDGVVKALREGTAVITCTASDGGYKASCTVKVTKGIKVTGVTLENGKTGDEANVGAVFNLIATVEPENASNKRLIWTSTNPEVATVSANGRVVTLKEGLTYIQVRTEDGRKTDSFRLNVVP